ncbi:phage tail protein [Undibacterium sp.]|jgi:microcystin-dependent protein|uniref:phage tail protein n=1 Tax=Undibacterium sp. TaxID=1914977 RepID=UPI002B788A9E|nr:tail fiber protein [Undibacterium sp.]HTD04893.1 tail fiber protein [Undibacterium sp.]
MRYMSSRSLIASSIVAVAALGAVPAFADTPFLGEIKCFSFNFAPKGWALTNGQLLAINQNQALFSLLGTTYGGDGRSTFALPNLQHRIMIGASDTRPLGDAQGTDSKTILPPNLPSHAHVFAPLGSSSNADSVSPAGNVQAVKARTSLYVVPSQNTGNVAMATGTTSAAGVNNPAPVSNLQPYLTFNCAIALQGIFPSRD